MRSSRPGFLLTLVLPAAPIGSADAHDHLVKEFAGGVAGRSTTQFSYAFDDVSGVGTYVAMEAFGGSLDGQPGSFAFAHSATSDGRSPERLAELFVIAPGSGTGELAGLTGGGRIINAEDGTHPRRRDRRRARCRAHLTDEQRTPPSAVKVSKGRRTGALPIGGRGC